MSQNIEWVVRQDKLIVTMDIGKAAIAKATPSSTGRTYLVASTGSAILIPGSTAHELKLQINLMAKKS